jgi:DNA-binding TFAR19-related protein (PDSD5 family)
MMHRSVAQVLENFDHLPPAYELNDDKPREAAPIKPIGYLSAEEALLKVEQAAAATRTECERQAEAFLALALEDQARKFEEQLTAARREWTEVQAERIMSQLVSVNEVLESKIAAALTRVLRPFVMDGVRKQAVTDMRACIGKTVASAAHPSIEVSGPQDLLDAIAAAMTDVAVAVSYRPDASSELRVVLGDTVLETQMQDWAARLSVAGPAQ